ncbi:MAG: hypothetical protein HY273_15210 [Gammaproteobacteria bacterium]|nr:hypothetical protein [Gammaproteobacteria bacterium]
MARYKPVHKGLKMLAVDFDRQVLPGSFEHALCHLIDHELDLGPFHAPYRNDDGGAPAFDPAALLKIVLLAYSHGIADDTTGPFTYRLNKDKLRHVRRR